jgi:hypothetical protein
MGDLNNQVNRAVWFDIPVSDLDRAIQFYKAVLAIDVFKESFQEFTFAVLDHKDGNGGCLIPKPEDISASGLLLYLNAEGRIRDAVSKTTSNGGKVLEDVTSIGPHGFRAVILDSEGNRLALHSNVDA